jgi:riboflavin synthase
LFTGLIVEMGKIVSLSGKAGGGRLSLEADSILSGAALGDSIAINGTCLTVVEISGKTLSFDLSDETLKSTNLGRLKPGDRVNLEPSLRPDSKMGGHFVTGHIDGVGRIKSKLTTGNVCKIIIDSGAEIAGFLVEKGSVAVDGISLTVVDVFRDGFSIVIIPHTSGMTTIGFKKTGEEVNLEVDILGKYVSKFLNKGKDATFMKTLLEEGFVL